MCFRAANSHGLDFKFSVTYCSQCSLPHPAAHQLAMLRHMPHSLSSPETPLLDCPKQPAFQVLKFMSSVTLPPPALDTPVSPLSLACRPRASSSPRTEKSAALAGTLTHHTLRLGLWWLPEPLSIGGHFSQVMIRASQGSSNLRGHCNSSGCLLPLFLTQMVGAET